MVITPRRPLDAEPTTSTTPTTMLLRLLTMGRVVLIGWMNKKNKDQAVANLVVSDRAPIAGLFVVGVL
ncbi:hypothetical protein ACFUIZ_31195 [Streptomyces cinereoruber]|uniref:hypothetical protein n=1 Tax=Streptomyces cinereoruber TaxID=67260 RepID=UPI0036377D66